MIDSSRPRIDALPMERFLRQLVRDSSLKGDSKMATADIAVASDVGVVSESAKSVFDFGKKNASGGKNNDIDIDIDIDNKLKNNRNSNSDSTAKITETFDTFDIMGLVLVSDNARVFAKARPKQNKDLLTSATWHSSSELRKLHTANARWGSTSDSMNSSMNKLGGSFSSIDFNSSSSSSSNIVFSNTSSHRNQSFNNLDRPPSAANRFDDPSGRRSSIRRSSIRRSSIRRRTSDSSLSVPTRSWMNQSQSQPQPRPQQKQRQKQRQWKTKTRNTRAKIQIQIQNSIYFSRYSSLYK
jgi:hypothetical protein